MVSSCSQLTSSVIYDHSISEIIHILLNERLFRKLCQTVSYHKAITTGVMPTIAIITYRFTKMSVKLKDELRISATIATYMAYNMQYCFGVCVHGFNARKHHIISDSYGTQTHNHRYYCQINCNPFRVSSTNPFIYYTKEKLLKRFSFPQSMNLLSEEQALVL